MNPTGNARVWPQLAEERNVWSRLRALLDPLRARRPRRSSYRGV